MEPINTSNPREAAFLAIMRSLSEQQFISDALEDWNAVSNPSKVDHNLAIQLANGASQMALALDFQAAQLAEKKKLSLKLKEKVILRLALYQYYFLERIPIYAIANEMTKLAKKYCHYTFANFLNAILRKVESLSLTLPKGDSFEELSVRFSYPLYFIKELVKDNGLEKAKAILEAGNLPPKTMVRLLHETVPMSGLKIMTDLPFPMAIIEENSLIRSIAASPDYYIQNATPVRLMWELAQHSKNHPKTILDLCASPGGKLLAVHHHYPDASLFANDLTEEKVNRLKENCKKFGLEASFSQSDGISYQSEEKFDLIILDVPCSNSGVLNKRTEARWRLEKDSLNALKKLQLNLIEQAKSLLNPNGEIWYMTCSILHKENEALIDEATQLYHLKKQFIIQEFPNVNGFDGGFGAILTI